MTRTFYNQFRLGDCLWSYHWLRHAALANPDDEFEFYCLDAHHWQLAPVLEGVKVRLRPLSNYYGGGVNLWINADGYYPPKDRDLVAFLCGMFALVAAKAGIRPVLTERAQWLFDYPALISSTIPINDSPIQKILLVDSPPQSGQFAFDGSAFARLTAKLSAQGHAVFCTNESKPFRSVTEWGALSMICDYIIMVSTGPSWATFNALTEATVKERFILLHDKEFINYGREYPHFSNLPALENRLTAMGLL